MTIDLFGLPIDGLNVPSFLAGVRIAFVILALLGAGIAAKRRDPRGVGRIVLAVGIVGHALAWFATMFPLPNVYGANGSMDRENHLGWANMVALGFSPLRTFQVNHLHFEPLWPLVTAAASGFDPARVPMVFQWAPLIVGILVLLSIRYVWASPGSGGGSAVEASFAAMGALLLMAVPGDFAGPFRNPWALTFLLKPNHALGLALAPLAALALSRAHDWKSRLFAGFILQLVGWAFVIHMALMVAGFAVFVALSFVTGSGDRRKDLLDVGTAVGVNLALVSPYLVMLLAAYPMFDGTGIHTVSPYAERALEAPLRLGVLLALGAYAAWREYHEGSRLRRILAAQWLAAQIVGFGFPLLGLFGQAREQDEAFYWCRFWTGAFAAAGAFRLVQRLGNVFQSPAPQVGRAAAAAVLLLLPSLVPAWWDPARMDQYFVASREPLPDWISEPMRFVREQTETDAVFAGERDYARWIAAYGGRRVLLAASLNAPADGSHRETVMVAILANDPQSLVREAFDRYRVRYVLVTSAGGFGDPDRGIDSLSANPRLSPVYDRSFAERRVTIFRLLPGDEARGVEGSRP
ncbi:MAG: hypothetical protein K1Y01_08590 [Vicinamibacteria bacterium]|nr:hypothetical protein [Vicinamibacteria bacterium]